MNRLVIGTRRYSSWSMRGWLAVRCAGLDVTDHVIPLRGGGQTTEIHRLSPNQLVPYLEHEGVRVWESLAICEYCAEFQPRLWPEEREARAVARSMSAQMHSGFRALRQALPMNTGRRDRPLLTLAEDVQQDIAQLDALLSETRAQFGEKAGYLFGQSFGIADIMYAPVMSRFHSYAVQLSSATRAYCDAVLTHPLVAEWYRLAELEPESWFLERYEALE